MPGKSIDDYMAEDQQYRDETKSICDYYKKKMDEAETDEEREQLRKQMCGPDLNLEIRPRSAPDVEVWFTDLFNALQ